MRVLVTGASGFIGGALVRALRGRGDEVYPVVRGVPELGEVRIDLVQRQLDTSRVPGGSLEGIDAAVHLAGAPITTRWSPKRLERIRSSRITVGNLLARSLATLERPPSVLVSGSAVGFYGDRGDEVLDEASQQGTGVLADLCRSWEQSTEPATRRGIRVVTIRTGIVLGGAGGADGGILAAEVPIFKLGLGARRRRPPVDELGRARRRSRHHSSRHRRHSAQRSGELDGPQPGAQRGADPRDRQCARASKQARSARNRVATRSRPRGRRRTAARQPESAAAEAGRCRLCPRLRRAPGRLGSRLGAATPPLTMS